MRSTNSQPSAVLRLCDHVIASAAFDFQRERTVSRQNDAASSKTHVMTLSDSNNKKHDLIG